MGFVLAGRGLCLVSWVLCPGSGTLGHVCWVIFAGSYMVVYAGSLYTGSCILCPVSCSCILYVGSCVSDIFCPGLLSILLLKPSGYFSYFDFSLCIFLIAVSELFNACCALLLFWALQRRALNHGCCSKVALITVICSEQDNPLSNRRPRSSPGTV